MTPNWVAYITDLSSRNPVGHKSFQRLPGRICPCFLQLPVTSRPVTAELQSPLSSVSVTSPFLSLIRTFAFRLRAHLGNPGWSQLKSLNLIASTKNLSPFWALPFPPQSRVLRLGCGHIFFFFAGGGGGWVGTIQSSTRTLGTEDTKVHKHNPPHGRVLVCYM